MLGVPCPEQLDGRRVAGREIPIRRRQNHDGIARGLEQLAVLLFALVQTRFVRGPVGDIFGDAEQEAGAPMLIHDRQFLGAQQSYAPVLRVNFF